MLLKRINTYPKKLESKSFLPPIIAPVHIKKAATEVKPSGTFHSIMKDMMMTVKIEHLLKLKKRGMCKY
jgi:hypothetical protein